MTTTWVERVETCRNWRYQMEGLPTNGPTPPSTTEWRDSCKRMFVESGKSQHTLEPTLQAALMEKPAWDLFQMTVKKFAKGELKDQQTQQTRKRIRKKQELTQNQLGMPLQGISLDSKVRLLRAVVAGELSLKEMMAKTARIKAKKTIIDAFMKHTGTDSWEELKSLYPEHTKEEQISQFSHLKFRKSNVPQELKDFFQRAVSLRERQREGRRKSESVVEMDGVHVFANGDAIAAKGTVDSPGIVEVKSACPEITGFELVVARVPKGLTPEDLKLFLINIHSLNIERMDHYNVVLLIEDTTDQQLLENVLKSKMISDGFQRLYWNNTKRLPLKGRKIANRLQAIIVGHWTDSGSLIPGSCHFDINELTTNVLSHDGEVEGEYPQPLLECLLRHFSYPEAWVYGLNITPGPFVRACVELSRKCVSISEDPRRDSRLIQKAFLCKRNDNFEEDEESVKESEEDEDEETLDQETANSQIMY